MTNRMIYVVRHGKINIEDNQRRYIGQLDLPLSEEGILQGQRLQKILDPVNLSTVFSSDLVRCQHTLKIIVGNKNVKQVIRKDLREINMGEWEGCTFAEIIRRFPDEFKARGDDIGYYRVSGGESFADCSKRVMTAFHESINSSTGHILFVGHGGVNRLFLCYILGMPIGNVFKIRQDYGCLNVITGNSSGYQVQLLNFRG